MAKTYQNKKIGVGGELIKDSFHKINENSDQLDADLMELYGRVDEKKDRILLETNSVPNATATPTRVEGVLTQVVWKDSGDVTLRTDTYTYSEDATTETITITKTLPNTSYLTIATVFDKINGDILSAVTESNV